MIKMIKNNYQYQILFLIIISGFFLRMYNINFDDLWYDEIISFWVANPDHTSSESFKIHNDIEVIPPAFNFLLKLFFQLFSYDANLGRYLVGIFGVLTIIITYYLSKILIGNFFLLPTFLVSFNIFLLRYSQELRVYSVLIFFATLSLFLFFKLLKKNPKKIVAIYFLTTLLILVFLHFFSLFIVGSYIIYLLLVYFKKKENYLYLSLILSIVTVIALPYYVHYIFNFFFSENPISNLELYSAFYQGPSLSFYTNFYFSKFFGSRFMGLIFLLTLIILILKNKVLFLKLDKKLTILIIIILSYSVPLIFGYLFQPILLPRYISYLPLFIILLISSLVFNIKERKKKNYFIIFLVLITLANLFTEQFFKQFYNPRAPSKPEYSKAIEYINTSNIKNYSLKVEKMKNNKASINAINNYIKHIGEKKNINLIFTKFEQSTEIPIWIICPMDINEKHCSLPEKVNNYVILKENEFNSINLKLIQNKK
jgi:4-amino-4-deoxy-L-arabinose transferase-like glycosyltransferase